MSTSDREPQNERRERGGSLARKLNPFRRPVRPWRIFLFGLPVLLLFVALSAELTSRPGFCTTCHYMEPFYESWATSSHADVSCVDCHFPPGLEGTIRGKMEGLMQVVNYVGRSYTRRRPWAEIEDSSCLQSGCHETRMLQGKVVFKGVTFDHGSHLGEMRRGKQLRCTSCHSQVVQGEHILVTETACFLCHFKEEPDFVRAAATETAHDSTARALTCTTCHDWDALPPDSMAHFRFDHTNARRQGIACTQCHSQTVVGDGYVPKDNCSACHFEHERLDKYDDPELLHRVHIAEHKVECVQCHLRIQHKIQRVSAEAELDCSACHTATHREQVLLFTGRTGEAGGGDPHAGTALAGDAPAPSPMFEAGLNCASCHVRHRRLAGSAGVREAGPEACDGCHGRGYARLLRQWETSADARLARFDQDAAQVEQTVAALPPAGRTRARHEVEKARYAMQLVRIGKAVHNVTFADRLVRTGYDHLNGALAAAGATLRLAGPPSGVVPGACANCHTGIDAVPMPYGDRSFSHATHAVDGEIACESCHSNERRHGERFMADADCNSCHHDPERAGDDCARCHTTEAALYAGTLLDRDEPDVMFAEEVTCTDCHGSGGGVHRPGAEVCTDCHDDDYADTAGEWQAEVKTLLDEVKALLAGATPEVRTSPEYRQAQAVWRTLRTGAAGVHNYELSRTLLIEARASLQSR